MRVTYKLGLSYLLAIAILFALVNIWGRDICKNKAQQNVKNQLQTMVSKLSDTTVANYYEGEGLITKFREELQHMEAVTGIRIWMVNSDYSVIADSGIGLSDSAITANDYDVRILDQNISENVIISKVFDEPMLVSSEPFAFSQIVIMNSALVAIAD